jgi:hypothetical protein
LLHRTTGTVGYELLLRSGAHVWRPRPLWLRSERIEPSIIQRDLQQVVAPLLQAIAAPGTLTEAEAADALIGLTFSATIDATGAVVKATAVIREEPGASPT